MPPRINQAAIINRQARNNVKNQAEQNEGLEDENESDRLVEESGSAQALNSLERNRNSRLLLFTLAAGSSAWTAIPKSIASWVCLSEGSEVRFGVLRPTDSRAQGGGRG